MQSWRDNKQIIKKLKENKKDYRDELNSLFNREKPNLDDNYDNKDTLSYDAIANGGSRLGAGSG